MKWIRNREFDLKNAKLLGSDILPVLGCEIIAAIFHKIYPSKILSFRQIIAFLPEI